MPSEHELRTALAHVLWIGGAPDLSRTSSRKHVHAG
jgi:hypothetical protein